MTNHNIHTTAVRRAIAGLHSEAYRVSGAPGSTRPSPGSAPDLSAHAGTEAAGCPGRFRTPLEVGDDLLRLRRPTPEQ